ncbi:hypothetical protein M0813_27893 [Anaeramoeba flamelloides]|uniref:Uncharacterized protein n=1 Tax=Anaeramoeba flamelloides TaxID=1746091 RepID=A0ABQ8XYK9_9EUKA|nr:hypothetical protein M0813_27893 [Anaeramoeba flamelloides]
MKGTYPIEQKQTKRTLLEQEINFNLNNEEFLLKFCLSDKQLEIVLTNLENFRVYKSQINNNNISLELIKKYAQEIKKKPKKRLVFDLNKQTFFLNVGFEQIELLTTPLDQIQKLEIRCVQQNKKISRLEEIIREQQQSINRILQNQEQQKLINQNIQNKFQKITLTPSEWSIKLPKTDTNFSIVDEFAKDFVLKKKSLVIITLQGHLSTLSSCCFLDIKIDGKFQTCKKEAVNCRYGVSRTLTATNWEQINFNRSAILETGEHRVQLVARSITTVSRLNGALMEILIIQ